MNNLGNYRFAAVKLSGIIASPRLFWMMFDSRQMTIHRRAVLRDCICCKQAFPHLEVSCTPSHAQCSSVAAGVLRKGFVASSLRMKRVTLPMGSHSQSKVAPVRQQEITV